MQKNSLKVGFIKLIGSLVAITSLIILVAIWFSTTKHANTQLSRDLDVGQSVFNSFIENRENLLISAASVLTEDFGFKQAVASKDSSTIESVLNNHSERIEADIMATLSLSGQLTSTSSGLNLTNITLLDQSSVDEIIQEGWLSTFTEINGRLYQAFFLTVDAPQPIAITMLGFEVNQLLIERVRELTTLDISFAFDQHAENFLTTLSDEDAKKAFNQFSESLDITQYSESGHYAHLGFTLTNYPNFSGFVLLSHNTKRLFKEFDVLLNEVVLISLLAISIALFIGVTFSKSLTKPLEQISVLAKAIASGDYFTKVSLEKGSAEINDLATAFTHMQSNIAERESTIQYTANHDMLTGLYNRNKMNELINDKLSSQQPFQLLAIQIKDFRELNETFGFNVGDDCVKFLAKHIESKGGKAARITGGEITWLPPKTLNHDDIILLQQTIEQATLASSLKTKIRLVVGIVESHTSFEKASDVLKSLSIAASHARLSSQFIETYHKEQESLYVQRLEILYELQNILEGKKDDELSMFYQPKLCLKTNKVHKMEALIRWHSEKLGFVSPELFIPIAERAGIIKTLTQWVIRRVVTDVSSWQEDNLQVAINLSAQDILSEDLLDFINGELTQNNLDKQRLSFEITESDIMTDADVAIAQLHKFIEEGFILSIDDFGTGHSSLAYIKDFPVNELKIDKAFILKLDENKDDQSIVKCVLNLASNFNLAVIAEGVENEASLALLRAFGCDYIQGYFISKPMPSTQVKAWLNDFNKTS